MHRAAALSAHHRRTNESVSGISMAIMSPSLDQRIGPPWAASGEMCPMAAPRVPAGKTAVGQQCDLAVQLHAGNRRGGREHFAHARPALGAFVADNDHVAGLNPPS
jgi:hypothetical protein